MATRKKSDAAPSTNTLAPPSTLALGLMGFPESVMSPMPHLLSSSGGPSSSYGPQQFLRIHTTTGKDGIQTTTGKDVDSVHRSTVVPVYVHTLISFRGVSVDCVNQVFWDVHAGSAGDGVQEAQV
jgi:hypothetical protein